MEHWFEEAESNAMPGAMLYLVGSKMDKASTHRSVEYEEGERLAEQHGAKFCEVSSKTRENVRKPFVEIVDDIVKHPQLLNSGNKRSGTISVNATGDNGSACAC